AAHRVGDPGRARADGRIRGRQPARRPRRPSDAPPGKLTPVRVAVVDIGSNSTRLLIADVVDGRVVAERDRRSTVTRLGAGVDADGHLRDDAAERVYKALDDYQRSIEEHGPGRRIAVLTSAVRDASNGSEFARSV